MTIAYLGLGSNLGDSLQILRDAVVCLAHYPNITVLRKAGIYLSSPVDTQGADFFNTVVSVETVLAAEQLYAICMQIECQFERKRPYRYAPRTLDMDVLLFGEQVMSSPTLTVPHPRMIERAFVLLPLAEIAENIELPGLGHIQQFLPTVAQQKIRRMSLTDANVFDNELISL